ncbi:MAG: hypothetical protein C4526_12260, partial [Nitrospiraceae bacterium]
PKGPPESCPGVLLIIIISTSFPQVEKQERDKKSVKICGKNILCLFSVPLCLCGLKKLFFHPVYERER